MNVARRFDITQSPLSGTVLIEASAGTGKTYAISGLYLRLVLEKALEVENILVVTFTVAATGELRERLRGGSERPSPCSRSSRIGMRQCSCGPGTRTIRSRSSWSSASFRFRSPRAAFARHTKFRQTSIFTIHSFCQRALLENAFESGALSGAGGGG